jgi:hypothetical protein
MTIWLSGYLDIWSLEWSIVDPNVPIKYLGNQMSI